MPSSPGRPCSTLSATSGLAAVSAAAISRRHIDRRDAIAAPRKRIGAGLAGAQRNVALGRPASHENGDVLGHRSAENLCRFADLHGAPIESTIGEKSRVLRGSQGLAAGRRHRATRRNRTDALRPNRRWWHCGRPARCRRNGRIPKASGIPVARGPSATGGPPGSGRMPLRNRRPRRGRFRRGIVHPRSPCRRPAPATATARARRRRAVRSGPWCQCRTGSRSPTARRQRISIIAISARIGGCASR